jgi:hypothetical protein
MSFGLRIGLFGPSIRSTNVSDHRTACPAARPFPIGKAGARVGRLCLVDCWCFSAWDHLVVGARPDGGGNLNCPCDLRGRHLRGNDSVVMGILDRLRRHCWWSIFGFLHHSRYGPDWLDDCQCSDHSRFSLLDDIWTESANSSELGRLGSARPPERARGEHSVDSPVAGHAVIASAVAVAGIERPAAFTWSVIGEFECAAGDVDST